MKKKILPLLFLVVFTTVFTELLTGNIPGPIFMHPVTLVLLIIYYGLPVIAIRDLAITKKLSVKGLFVMGLAYGIFNEGIVAKTLLMADGLPLPSFDGYTLSLGLSIPWMLFIIVWHAINSVILPITVCNVLFPAQKEEAWLSPKAMWTVLIIPGALGGLQFFRGSPTPTVLTTVLIIALIFVLSRVSYLFFDLAPKSSAPKARSIVFGFLFVFIHSLVLMTVAGMQLPLLLYILIAVGLPLGLYKLLQKMDLLGLHNIAYYAVGNYAALAIIRLTATSAGYSSLMGIAFLITIAGLYFAINKQKST